ncbi:MAG TPA: acyl-CoA dehydrogenase family protein [Solirubrobacteraceae bacterium]|nr:acyl-CoA dehydrogenase family protein [Solirubrobacteraceae bacterium]
MTEALQDLRQNGPSPEAESAALGQWLAPRDGLITVAPDPTLRRVPFARQADWIAWVLEDRVAVVPRHQATVLERVNLAGEPRDTVVLGGAAPELGRPIAPDAVRLRGALIRAVLMAGALERAAEIAIAYAGQRQQFGRPIASFQAVQALLVTIAQQAALVGVAADAALASQAGFEIASAKLLANRAATTAARAAHQVLGARGVTLEHPLSVQTKRLWAWRHEYGGELEWSTRLGAAAAAAGADSLYPAITDGSGALDV